MITVINGTVETVLDDGTLGYLVAYDGWGMTPNHRLSDRGSLQHGETDRGFRLDPRFGSLVFQMPAGDPAAMYDIRDVFLSLFSPANSPKIRFDLPNGKTRQIDVVYYDDMLLPWTGSESGFSPKISVTLKASDPTFYDPSMIHQVLSTGLGGDPWDIPWLIPWEIGGSTANGSAQIIYPGSFQTFPIIRIVGPITSPIITNQSTGKKLDFTGTTIGSGLYYEIDTRYGKHSVKDETGAKQISKLTSDSHLTTFYIAAASEVPGGVNTINLQGSGATAVTQITISYYIRYVGI